MKLKMLPADEHKYLQQLREATDEEIGMARLLHAASFDGTMPQIPAPVYMRQAMWFSSHGFVIKESDNGTQRS